jgi:hypothetical protein
MYFDVPTDDQEDNLQDLNPKNQNQLKTCSSAMRQRNPLKRIRGTINLVIPTGDGNPKINVIGILGVSFENLNKKCLPYQLIFFYDFHAALGPSTAEPVHAKENVENKRLVYACCSV